MTQASHDTTPNSYDDNEIVNPSTNLHLNDLVAARMSRRQVLRGGVGATTVALLGGVALSACGGGDDTPAAPATRVLALDFTAVDKNQNDLVTVPAGYQVSILHALGDPQHFGDTSWAGDGSESADSYNRRIGDGHDGMHYFGLSEAGKYEPTRSDRGLLCVNHEYVVAPFVLHPAFSAGYNGVGFASFVAGTVRVAAEVDKEIAAHGVSITEIKRGSTGTAMTMSRGSRFNRRITSGTTIDFTGPVRGSDLVKTRFSPTGTQTRGTNNNCANGYTPWGTYLTCEENFLNVISRGGDAALRSAKEVSSLARYGLPANRRSPYQWDSVGPADEYARFNSTATAASADLDFRNTINTFGWVVEIDPFNPDSVPAKRTALGRFNHEGAWPAPAVVGQPIVIYSGDDARNEYIYKYVSTANWDAADLNGGMAAGAKYLDNGKLYVAKFNADGTGNWVELSFGVNGLNATNTLYAFADQADVLVNARLAADSVGATKMDRPEWGAVHPTLSEVYMTLTNNNAANRVDPASAAALTGRQVKPDAANPRWYNDGEGNTANPNGHIIRWKETGATAFAWDIYLFGAENDAAADVNLSGLTAVNDFSSPDGACFDPRGVLWIETDDGAYTDVTNCMLLAALPGKVGDGGPATAVGGTATIKGANATADNLRRFLVGPKDCEITGFAMTPDAKTMFINVQHPGENSTNQSAGLTSHWPDSQTTAASTKRPRSATVCVARVNGGEIGLA
jgi:hypothetical protein